MFIGLQDSIPVQLGATGTLIMLGMFLVSAALNIWQLYKAKNIERLTNALHVTETEMDVYKSRAERQTKELAEANQTIGELRAKTDLSEVLTMLSETISLTRESVELSRKADRENAQANLQLAQLIEHHGENDKQVFGSIDLSLKNTAEMLQGLTEEIRDHRKDAHAMIESVLKAIKRGPHERTRQGD